jgi:genome maintenance exonuclease 1
MYNFGISNEKVKMFKHNKLNPICFPVLKTQEGNGRRYYITPEGKYYPSITTLLGQCSKESLENWKKAIGEDAAKDISDYACSLGENLHYVIEKYLDNDPNYLQSATVHSKYIFISLQETLDRIDNIYTQEAALYSDALGLAGRTDCIAEFDGIPSIIDFKTSRKEKKPEWITNYFVQGTAYSLMFEEMTNIKIRQIVIIMGTHDSRPLIFKVNRSDYVLELKRIIDKYLGDLQFNEI